MSLSSAPSCARCGQAVPPGATFGECPYCLMTAALESPAADRPSLASGAPCSGRHFGDFLLGRQIGSGGMGIVYEATQVSLNRQVAVKFIRDSQVASPTLLRRFTIEAEATARLHHPNIVAIHEIGEIDGQPFFSMALVDGESLRSAMTGALAAAQDGTKSAVRHRHVAVARLIAKTARALHHAHLRGVLHRDVKPANILIDRCGEPHLTDFGLAKILRPATDPVARESLTGSGDIAGTPNYMSPEQAGSNEVTHASDIYSLGAVLYELLTGEPPFRGSTPLETLQRVQNHAVRNPRTLRPLLEKNLETICLKCLEKDPKHRYVSSEALAEDLENWIEHRPIKARPAGPVLRVTQWMHRNRTGSALIAVLTVALLGALVVVNTLKRQNRRIELHQGMLSQEWSEQVLKEWVNSNCQSLAISPQKLAILGDRSPPDSTTVRSLVFGLRIRGDPVTFAQQNTTFFAQMESALSTRLGEPFQLELVVFKNDLTNVLAQPALDVALLDAPSYLRAEQQGSATAIAQKDRARELVIMASGSSGITRLSDLSGRRIRFHRPQDTVTIWAKAFLADHGLLARDFNSVVHSVDSTSVRLTMREISAAVLLAEVDAGATLTRRFNEDRSKPPGLVELARITSSPGIYAVRPGLPGKIKHALREALLEATGATTEEAEESPAGDSWYEPIHGAAELDPSMLERLRGAMRKAAQFDGQPEPFAPNDK